MGEKMTGSPEDPAVVGPAAGPGGPTPKAHPPKQIPKPIQKVFGLRSSDEGPTFPALLSASGKAAPRPVGPGFNPELAKVAQMVLRLRRSKDGGLKAEGRPRFFEDLTGTVEESPKGAGKILQDLVEAMKGGRPRDRETASKILTDLDEFLWFREALLTDPSLRKLRDDVLQGLSSSPKPSVEGAISPEPSTPPPTTESEKEAERRTELLRTEIEDPLLMNHEAVISFGGLYRVRITGSSDAPVIRVFGMGHEGEQPLGDVRVNPRGGFSITDPKGKEMAPLLRSSDLCTMAAQSLLEKLRVMPKMVEQLIDAG